MQYPIKIKKVILMLFGFSLMINLNILKTNAASAYTPTCLESRSGDSKSFGTSLAVDGDYLAVGDPEANRVVIYTRKTDGNWQRKHEIYPPKSSLAKKREYGFGSEIALNNDVLAIRAYDDKRIIESVMNKNIKLGFETYLISLKNLQDNELQKVVLPTEYLFVDSLEFLGDKVVLLGKIEVSAEEWSTHVFLIDSITGKIAKNIKFLDSDYSLEKYSLAIDSDEESLFIGLKAYSLLEDSPYLITEEGRIEKIVLEEKTEDFSSFSELRNRHLIRGAISENLIAISTVYSPWLQGGTVLLKRYPKPSLIDVVSQHGLIHVKNSFVLISVLPDSEIVGNKISDHIFIKVDKNEVITKSKIRWERSIRDQVGYYIPTNGLIDSDSLLLSAYGIVVRLPIKNLPSSYKIKNSHC
ncbi:hypothetical protein Xen7305DRAFT_00041950 [Xenococcus sp. PCC 7305]|uniref:hypothetical protein n=1 Tax=Xenococcus sp. PCC 7305 TaxID=102125 RepID=UPI0002AC518F|nr:hypothetical protein [Xenococcus sp. PCC 7305]ELS04461.1 hypothetical protein Xen7305DRAFT_00041950 [Xenococcus sp. PCC 7305]